MLTNWKPLGAWRLIWVPAMILATTEGASAAVLGQNLAQHWCAQCHDIRPGGSQSPNPLAPPFAKLAADPSITELTLRATLQMEHETMPPIMFKPDQLDDLVGYILSLKPKG